jgi:carbon monoxide dehydrogenase subunit G
LEIQQSFHIPFAPEDVWRCFHDIESIVGCLPGAGLAAPPSGGALMVTMTVKLGPIVATFAGPGTLTLDDTERRGSIAGTGSDRRSGSRIKGEAIFSLHDATTEAASTRVDIRVDYSIAGSLAQFSRSGLVQDLAERLTAQFSDNLRIKLERARAAPAVRAAAHAPAPAPPATLDLARLFWPMLIARLKRWMGLSGKRSADARSRRD